MMRFAPLFLLAVLISSGCSQTSPIMEYNAAIQAYDRDDARLQEVQKALREVSKEDKETIINLREREKRFQDSLSALDKRINGLRKRL